MDAAREPEGSSCIMGSMLLMSVMGALLATGLALGLLWGGRPYRAWQADLGPEGAGTAGGCSTPPRQAALRYARGLALALTGGFWAGALVTGPAVRLAMRLLAVTGGDEAQGKLTEADQIIGTITVDGTIGLYVFGGILPGLLSGAIYVLVRRWLPSHRLGGLAFGALHLIVAATRIDPLRPDNPDFDLVGPGWLAALTFGLASIAHGMAVAAFVNRYSALFPPQTRDRGARVRAAAPLALPALLVVANVFLLIPVVIGLAVAVALLSADGAARLARARSVEVAGRAVLFVIALISAPGAIAALADISARG